MTRGSPLRRRVYGAAVETAETLWNAAKAGDQPDPGAACKIIDGLAKFVTQNRTSLMALTALKKYDNDTFTHGVNVSVLAMARAWALDVDGPLLRENDSPAFNQTLLKRFVNLLGLYPVWTLVRLNTLELAVDTAEHPSNPFRPQVTIISNAHAELLEEPQIANTWERDGRGEHTRAVAEALDPEALDIDPLAFM
jgi:HD-GYP domain-containing protein (c-di-GMP phosphodiesterase class II)